MQDVSAVGEGQFGGSLELGSEDSDRQVECGDTGNTLDGSLQDSLRRPVEEEEDDTLVPTGELKISLEEDISNLPSSRIDAVEREAKESEEVEKRKFRGIGKRAREFKFRGLGKRFRGFGNQILGKRKYSFKGLGKRDPWLQGSHDLWQMPWLMNESNMAGFEKRRYKIRGVGKRKYKIRGVGKRRQYNFRCLFGIDGDRLGKRPFSFWGKTDPRAAVANRLYMLRSKPHRLGEDRDSCSAKDEDFPKMARFNKFPMGKRWDGDTLKILQTNLPNDFGMGFGDMK